MKALILAAVAAVTLGLGVADAASWRTANSHTASGTQYNWMAGGGG